MQRLIFFLLITSLYSCGTSYHYYSPPANNYFHTKENELQVSGLTGTNGTAFKLGYSLDNRNALISSVHLSSPLKYRGSELEGAYLYGKLDSANGAYRSIAIGSGLGTNYEKTPDAAYKNFRGDFIKPFVLLSFGSCHKSASIGNFYADGAVSLKLNYLIYRGHKATTINNISAEKTFNSNIFFAQPYFNVSAGLKIIRINMGVGTAIKKKYEFDKNLAVYPVEANVGILFFIGRKTESPPEKF